MNNNCEGKHIERVLVTSTKGEQIVGYVCYEKEYDQDDFLGLYQVGEPIVVYKLNSPNTGVSLQAGYDTLVFSQDEIVSIKRFSEVDPGIVNGD